MQLTREQLEQLVEQARRDAPLETCGIIAGKDRRALVIYPLKNVDSDAGVRYLADPHEQLLALRDVEDHGWEMIGIYHSHPAGPAYPSPTDVARAYYPDAVYLLISLADPAHVIVRGFEISDGEIKEVTLEIEDKNEPSRTNPRRATERTGRSHAGRAVAALSKRRLDRRRTGRPRRRIPKKV